VLRCDGGASGERLVDERVVADGAGERERLVGARRRLFTQAEVEVDLGEPASSVVPPANAANRANALCSSSLRSSAPPRRSART
jgi:hypothetical protein